MQALRFFALNISKIVYYIFQSFTLNNLGKSQKWMM